MNPPYPISLEQRIWLKATNTRQLLQETSLNKVTISSQLSRLQPPDRTLFDNLIEQYLDEALASPVGWIRVRAQQIASL